jgi:Zn-dependent protease with chaperone function
VSTLSFAAAIVAMLTGAGPALANPQLRDPVREQRIVDELSALAPAAAPDFQRATQALDAGDYAAAIPLYGRVLTEAPEFAPAMRRLGLALMQTGHGEEGLQYIERAVARQRSPENLVSLAQALAFPRKGVESPASLRQTALELAKEASQAKETKDDPSYLGLVAQLALSLNRLGDFKLAVAGLAANAPNSMATHYFAAIRAAIDHEWGKAEREIGTAERLGLPHQAAQAFLDAGVAARARAWRYAYVVLAALGLWATGLGVLFVAGRLLSSATLRSLANADPNSDIARSEVRLRKVYRALIRMAGLYYYVSMPFVIILVLGGTAAVVYGFLMLGQIPIGIVFALVTGALVTTYKMVQSLFVHAQSDEAGRSLAQREAPGLWDLAMGVAATVGTRPIDEIRVTPGTEMAVYERGSAKQKRDGQAERVLIVGVGLLNGFRQDAFRAVLAHEYGHFSHGDTAGGDIALRVRQNMMKFAIAMAQNGQAVWWNLAFQFLRVYDFLYRRISHGATRLQEILADRVAARLYGPDRFEEGLRHVVRRAVEFKTAADDEIRVALHANRSIRNLYTLPAPPPADVDGRFEDAIGRETTEDDTHPSPADRFRLTRGVTWTAAPQGEGMVWDLFQQPEALTNEMTEVVQRRVKAVSGM